MPVSASHRRKHHVTARYFAFVHFTQVDSLVVHPKGPFVTVQFVADGAKDASCTITSTGSQDGWREGRVTVQNPLLCASFSSFLPGLFPILSLYCQSLSPRTRVAVLSFTSTLQVIQQDTVIAALIRLLWGLHTATWLCARGSAQVQHHVVIIGAMAIAIAMCIYSSDWGSHSLVSSASWWSTGSNSHPL